MNDLPGLALKFKVDNARPTVEGDRVVVNLAYDAGGAAILPSPIGTNNTVPSLLNQSPPAALAGDPITVDVSAYGSGNIALLWVITRNLTAENNVFDFSATGSGISNNVRLVTPVSTDYYTGLVAVQLSNNSFVFHPTASATAEIIYTVYLVAIF